MTTPLISVLMPVYNGEKYLREAIDSILAQTFADFEFIIINDGSTDNTEKVILSYDDPRIRYVKNHENLQIVRSLNKGIVIARGKYIARMDADDISLPERFKRQITFMETHPKVAICGSWLEIFGDKKKYWKYPIEHDEIKTVLLFNCSLAHPSVMMRKMIFETLRYDENYNKCEDYDLWVRATEYYKLYNIPSFLVKHRLHSNQTEQSLQQLNANKIRKRILAQGIGCELDSSEFEEFYQIASFNQSSIKTTKKILKKIYAANQNSAYINETKLSYILSKKILETARKDKRKTIHDLIDIYSSSFFIFSSVPLTRHLKLCLDCCLNSVKNINKPC